MKELKESNTHEVTERLGSLQTDNTKVDNEVLGEEDEEQGMTKEKKTSKAQRRREKQKVKHKVTSHKIDT